MAVRTTSVVDGGASSHDGARVGQASAPDRLAEVRFRVMGTDAHVAVVVSEPGDRGSAGEVDGGARQLGSGLDPSVAAELERTSLLDLAVARLDRLDATWSRFRSDSELSTANDNPGEWVGISDDTAALVDRALMSCEVTGGRFDPTLLGEVVAAGYDRSLAGDGRPGPGPATAVRSLEPQLGAGNHRRRAVQLDRAGRRMRVEHGYGFDPGGIAKGFAADLVVGELLAAGADGACVNIGGDLRVGGDVDDGWTVAIEDPLRPDSDPIGRLSIAQGAVATSSRCRRRWTRSDGSVAHHLIDPTTGAPARTEVLAVTVVAAHGWTAEALATAAFLAGPDGAEQVLGSAGATGVLVTARGPIALPGFEEFLIGGDFGPRPR